mgnify:CR=1 FL=1|tara:strand:- start:375 stop:611 length:237 start_codon:yes stop_codon:yes gene_type:complete
MTYYIFFDNEITENIWDENTLGEESFDVFYPGGGFMALHNIINNKPELIEKIVIKDEQARNYSVTKFLDKLEKWRIKT